MLVPFETKHPVERTLFHSHDQFTLLSRVLSGCNHSSMPGYCIQTFDVHTRQSEISFDVYILVVWKKLPFALETRNLVVCFLYIDNKNCCVYYEKEKFDHSLWYRVIFSDASVLFCNNNWININERATKALSNFWFVARRWFFFPPLTLWILSFFDSF